MHGQTDRPTDRPTETAAEDELRVTATDHAHVLMLCSLFFFFLCQPSGEALGRGLLLVVLRGDMCRKHRVVRNRHEGLAADLTTVAAGVDDGDSDNDGEKRTV